MDIRASFLCIPLLLQACVSIPDSPDVLIRTSSTKAMFCYQEQVPVVKNRMRDFLGRCYGPVTASTMIPVRGSLVPISINMDFTVIEEELPEGTRLSVKNRAGVGYSLDVNGKSEGCITTVNMYAVTGLWKRVFIQADKAAKGEEATCPR